MTSFKGILLNKSDAGFSAGVADIAQERLPDEGNVVVRIAYSTINYKDALAITHNAPVVRKWPMVAGIDGAGVVESSSHAAWKPGDKVILNGFGVGENHWGCLAQYAKLNGDWLVRLPDTFSFKQAMAIGTAGYTAMLCCLALERHGVKHGQGEILVTGASGGVGAAAGAGASTIAEAAHRGDDPQALAAVRIYYRALGHFAQTLALSYLPCAAVVIGGASTTHNRELLAESGLAETFAEHPRFGAMLSGIPVRTVDGEVNLEGGLWLAAGTGSPAT